MSPQAPVRASDPVGSPGSHRAGTPTRTANDAADDTEPATQPNAGWPRLLWQLGGGLVLLLVAYIGVAHWRGEAQWRRLQAEAAVVQAALDAREPARPVLWGEAHAGAAWPHYERAFALLLTPDKSGAYTAHLGRVEGARLAGSASVEPAREGPSAAQLVADHATALAALRTGAHQTDGRRPMQWSAGFDHDVQDLLNARTLANVCVVAAILAAGDGNGREAVHVLLDALQLGRDLAQSSLLIEQMIGGAVLGIGSRDALAWSNLLRHLDPDALRALGEGLARLDSSVPLGSDWLASEAVLFAHHSFEAPRKDDPFAGLTWRAWRYGFSTRLVLANHGLAQLALAARVRALCGNHDALDVAALERVFTEHATSPNPATRIMLPNVGSALRNRLQTVALLRLMRMATQHAAGEDVPPLPDPSGGTLRWAVGADGDADFWSDVDRKRISLRLPK